MILFFHIFTQGLSVTHANLSLFENQWTKHSTWFCFQSVSISHSLSNLGDRRVLYMFSYALLDKVHELEEKNHGKQTSWQIILISWYFITTFGWSIFVLSAINWKLSCYTYFPFLFVETKFWELNRQWIQYNLRRL